MRNAAENYAFEDAFKMLEELGEFNIDSDNLIFVQKSIGGNLFVDVKGRINQIFCDNLH